MDKRGIITTLLGIFMMGLLIVGGVLYIKLRTSGLEFETGNIVVRLDYEDDESDKKGIENNGLNRKVQDRNKTLEINRSEYPKNKTNETIYLNYTSNNT